MRPRVHKYLADRFRELHAQYDLLPLEGEPALMAARDLIQDRLSEAMKHIMRADSFTRWGARQKAAASWRSARDNMRRAHTLIQAARIIVKYGDRS